MVREDQGVRHDDVFAPRGVEDDDLCDVVGREGIAAAGSVHVSTPFNHSVLRILFGGHGGRTAYA